MSSLARVRVRVARVITGTLSVAALFSSCSTADQSASRPEGSSANATGSATGGAGGDAPATAGGASTAAAAACSVRGSQGASVQKLSGTHRTVSRVRPPRVAVCGQVPPHADDTERHASRRACA